MTRPGRLGAGKQCPVCREQFSSATAFFDHRIGRFPNFTCKTVDEMLAIGMKFHPDGVWLCKPRTRKTA